MVMFIISALFCLPLIVLAGMGIYENMVLVEGTISNHFEAKKPKNYTIFFCHGIQVFVALVEVVIAISAAILSCHVFSSGKYVNTKEAYS